MEVKVVIGFDSKAEFLLERLVGALNHDSVEVPAKKEMTKAPEEVSDVEMAEVSKENADKEEAPDYAALKKEAKSVGIKLVQMKKKEDVQKLTEKYGYKKISDVADKDIAAYLNDLKAIMEAA